MQTSLEQIRAYHERSKHDLEGGYARGPEYLDWDDQPNPFRRFKGTSLIKLPLQEQQNNPSTDKELNFSSLAALLELSFGLSAWKRYGPDTWALRCTPSSGNLHPTEVYILASGCKQIDDGLYHYAPHEHGLERRGSFALKTSQPRLLIGLSSIFWREAWKYGERAFRYAQLDIGHALGAIRFAAYSLGLKIKTLPLAHATIEQLLGLDRTEDFLNAETEHPELLLQVEGSSEATAPILPEITKWFGQANHLGGTPKLKWPIIETAAQASYQPKPDNLTTHSTSNTLDVPQPFQHHENLKRLIKQRRSAQAFRGKESFIDLAQFYQMIESLLPNRSNLPWDGWHYPNHIHLLFFIHRVNGLEPGLYFLVHSNSDTKRQEIKAATNQEFIWQKPINCPTHLPFYQLSDGDIRKQARTLSCHQEIASAGCFSLAMLAEFEQGLSQGAHFYRQMHWEAGFIGQILYLQAETINMRGTGIGCFFDNGVHQLLGLKDNRYQVLYHFTLGKPVIDQRLETLPPYYHLEDSSIDNE